MNRNIDDIGPPGIAIVETEEILAMQDRMIEFVSRKIPTVGASWETAKKISANLGDNIMSQIMFRFWFIGVEFLHLAQRTMLQSDIPKIRDSELFRITNRALEILKPGWSQNMTHWPGEEK